MKHAIAWICMLLLLVGAVPASADVLTRNERAVSSDLSEPLDGCAKCGSGRHDLIVKWAESDNYLEKALGMFGRGSSNVLAGWAELFIQPWNWSQNSPAMVGPFLGLCVGAAYAVLRTGSGVVDLATFWVPGFKGLPMPRRVLGTHCIHDFQTEAEEVVVVEK